MRDNPDSVISAKILRKFIQYIIRKQNDIMRRKEFCR